ncbi:hypothetical protein Bca101_064294 [Brassica carinata]
MTTADDRDEGEKGGGECQQQTAEMASLEWLNCFYFELDLVITLQPEGDPAQHLVQEILFRAAKKAALDFEELLEIPQGERRRYHDDVTIVVISLAGRMWKSCL